LIIRRFAVSMNPNFAPSCRGKAIGIVGVALLLNSLIGYGQTPLAGAPSPARPPKESPLTAEEQLATFSVPSGYKIELVAAEPDGGKFVAINFDHAGRMWTMTALEYPLDANEAGAEARALFTRGGRDRVLVFDTPTASGRQKSRTFADGLVMPLGLLPYKDGAFVQYDGEIRFYRDTDGDGRADKREAVLTGFGIEDSHLFPHQFTRAPGGWILMAQGAFNYSKVKAGDGSVTDFNKTKLARFTPDGKRFEIIGWGPCNIWGLVIDRLGEVFIQEANDQGWPMMPFLEGASYPLCGDDVPRPYAPPFPKTGEKEMGGTGLSGLAFSEGADSFPGAYRDVFFIANPITGKIQAVRCHRGPDSDGNRQSAIGDYGNGWRLEHLPDFVLSGDPWFRPVAIAFGPDGCLYIVDWYNKIISHNEVPRNHPERDKTRGRIWRVRHESQPPRTNVPNLYKVSDKELLVHLRAANTWEVNAAWQEIVDRQAVSLAPDLARLTTDPNSPPDVRLRALWSLEGLGQVTERMLVSLAAAPQRSLRREAIRVARSADEHVLRASNALSDSDRLVRQEAIRFFCDSVRRSVAANDTDGVKARVTQLLRIWRMIFSLKPDSREPKWRDYFTAFEEFLVRSALEAGPSAVTAWLDSERAADDSPEDVARACLTLGVKEGARRLAKQIRALKRLLKPDELTLLASGAGEPEVRQVLPAILADPSNQAFVLRLLYDNRSRLTDHATLAPLLTDSARALVTRDPGDASHDLLVKLATGFRLTGLENELIAAATKPGVNAERQVAALRALRESGSTRVDVFRQFAVSGNDAIRREAVAALAVAKNDAPIPALLEVWPSLTSSLRKTAVDRLASSAASAKQLVASVQSGAISREELDGYTLDKLTTVLPDDELVKQLVAELGSSLKPVLRLDGGDGDYVDTDLTLRGPFTVECWVKLDLGINNQDSILAGSGALDANFHDSRFRVWVGGGNHDIVIASKPIAPDAWTHVAFTRDADGRFRLYLNGELDVTSTASEKRDFEHLKVGHSNVPGGTAGEFAEFRVWSACCSPDEIRATANLTLESARGLPGRRDKTVDPAPPNSPGSVPESSAAARMAALRYHGSGESWGNLHGNARIERTADLPPLQNEAEAKALEAKFAQFRALANRPGDAARGQQVFIAVCAVCHTVKGQGGKIGPVLDGAGANGIEALLRNILTPNAAMEAGYRRFRVETRDGEVTDGLLVSQDDQAYVLRQQGNEDRRIARGDVKRAAFTRLSMMPEGLVEPLPPEQVTDLFAYLKTLK
jgi:putative membrane-bound dehydrogenase-like protein